MQGTAEKEDVYGYDGVHVRKNGDHNVAIDNGKEGGRFVVKGKPERRSIKYTLRSSLLSYLQHFEGQIPPCPHYLPSGSVLQVHVYGGSDHHNEQRQVSSRKECN